MRRITPILIAATFLTLSSSYAASIPRFKHAIVDAKGPKDPWIKVVGDLNGDGRADIIIGGRKGPVVWYASPDWRKTVISARGGYNTVDGEVADLDRDGDNDVVIGAQIWYENPGPREKPSRSPWREHRITETTTHDIELADLDGDGDIDMVGRDQSGFGHNAGNVIHFWRQESPAKWTHRTVGCPHGEGLCLADLDRDGDTDVVAGALWLENTKDIVKGSWTKHAITTNWHRDTAVAAGDINADGRPDVVLARSEGPYRLSWFAAPADPRSPAWKEHPMDPSVDFAHGIVLADFDRDGDLDVVTAEMHQSKRDRVLLYCNSGKGKGWTPVIIATTGSHNLRVADFGKNGRPDIMGANWSGPRQPIEVWINQGE